MQRRSFFVHAPPPLSAGLRAALLSCNTLALMMAVLLKRGASVWSGMGLRQQQPCRLHWPLGQDLIMRGRSSIHHQHVRVECCAVLSAGDEKERRSSFSLCSSVVSPAPPPLPSQAVLEPGGREASQRSAHSSTWLLQLGCLKGAGRASAGRGC